MVLKANVISEIVRFSALTDSNLSATPNLPRKK